MNQLSEFVESERERFTTADNNRFAFSFSKIIRYREFIQIICERRRDAGLKFVKNVSAFNAAIPSGGPSLTDEQRTLLDEGNRLTSLLHLEIESFFLVAKILLDKIAHSIEFYFGPARGESLDSHDDLAKNIGDYAEKKQLKVPPGMLDSADSLKKDISDFRDYQIAHEKNPRSMRGTAFSFTDGRASMISTTIYPTAKDQQVQSKDMNDLLKEIDSYIGQVIELIKSNRDSTRLEIGSPAGPPSN